MDGNLPGGAIAPPDERVGDPAVQFGENISGNCVNEHGADPVVRESVATRLAIRTGADEACRDGFAHRQTNRGFAPATGVDHQPHVEVAAENSRGAKNRLAACGEAGETLRDQGRDPRRQPELGHRTPLPALA